MCHCHYQLVTTSVSLPVPVCHYRCVNHYQCVTTCVLITTSVLIAASVLITTSVSLPVNHSLPEQQTTCPTSTGVPWRALRSHWEIFIDLFIYWRLIIMTASSTAPHWGYIHTTHPHCSAVSFRHFLWGLFRWCVIWCLVNQDLTMIFLGIWLIHWLL